MIVEITDVDALAQIIRRVDGSNKLGAGALAEAILAALSPAPQALAGEAEWSPTGEEQVSWYTRMSDEDRRIANAIMRDGCAEHARLTRALRDAEIASGIDIAALRARVAEMEAVAPISVRLSPEYRRGYWAGFAHGERTTLRKLLGRGHPDMIQKLPPLAEPPAG